MLGVSRAVGVFPAAVRAAGVVRFGWQRANASFVIDDGNPAISNFESSGAIRPTGGWPRDFLGLRSIPGGILP